MWGENLAWVRHNGVGVGVTCPCSSAASPNQQHQRWQRSAGQMRLQAGPVPCAARQAWPPGSWAGRAGLSTPAPHQHVNGALEGQAGHGGPRGAHGRQHLVKQDGGAACQALLGRAPDGGQRRRWALCCGVVSVAARAARAMEWSVYCQRSHRRTHMRSASAPEVRDVGQCQQRQQRRPP